MRSLLLASIAILSISCAGGNDPRYGEPVFGKVKDAYPVVSISQGQVKGENRDGVAIFRGIPYGSDASGENRFKKASPAASWEGVRACTANGPIAVQNGMSISGAPGLGDYFSGGHPELFGVADEKQGENCLVLNVLTPGIDKAGRPVLVYIHGGGFDTGSGTLVLGADKLAREEDLVIVGVNHRLNLFGFLYLGHLDKEYASSGMVGMTDLVLALEWVRDNIASFGGDPGNVTIMGESGGAMKVSTLMAMDSAKGLFHKAIAESGSAPACSFSTADAQIQTDRFLSNLGLDRNNWKDILAMPSQTLIQASSGIAFSPVADNINLRYDGSKDILAYEVSKNIPLLVGSSADEMGVFLPIASMGITEDNLPDKVRQQLNISEENARQIVGSFKTADTKADAPWHTFLKIVSLSGTLGGGAFNQAMAKSAQNGAPVFNYFVEYDAFAPFGKDFRCAWHTADLPLQMRIVLDPEAEHLSKLMAHAWAAFARTGNPSTKELEWPAFKPQECLVMDFDEQTRVLKDPTAPFRKALGETVDYTRD